LDYRVFLTDDAITTMYSTGKRSGTSKHQGYSSSNHSINRSIVLHNTHSAFSSSCHLSRVQKKLKVFLRPIHACNSK